MLPDASAVTAAREKRRKFALRKIKKAQARAHGSGAGKFVCLEYEACVTALQI